MAGMYAVNGANGKIIWQLTIENTPPDFLSETSNFYTPVIVSRDFDADGLNDLVIVHGGDPLRAAGQKTHLAARIAIISSKLGIENRSDVIGCKLSLFRYHHKLGLCSGPTRVVLFTAATHSS